PESVFADDEGVGAVVDDGESDEVIAGARTDPANAGGAASHRAYRALVAADRVTAVGDHRNIVAAVGEDDVGEGVALFDADRDGAVRPVVSEVGELRLFNFAGAGRKENKLVL